MNIKSWRIIIVVLAIVNVILFWPGALYFLNDDLVHIPLTAAGKLFQMGFARPLHELLVRVDLSIWGKQAYGYHVTALILHAIVCVQLFDLSMVIQQRWLKINKEASLQASFLAVCLFLVYPQHAESIAWILGRTPVLSTVFFLLCVRLFFSQRFTTSTYVVASLSFAAALFTYEQAILVPFVFGLFAFLYKERRKPLLTFAIATLCTSAMYVVIRKVVTNVLVAEYEAQNFVSFQFKTLLANFFRILSRLILNPSHPSTYMFAVALLTLLLIALTWFLLSRMKPGKNPLFIFVSLIVVLVIPVVSLGVTIRSYESGRYLYLPSVFLVIALAIIFVSFTTQYHQYIFASRSVLVFLMCYWMWGKVEAAIAYRDASAYARRTETRVIDASKTTSDTIYVDTLKLTVHRLPVFRMGFKTGMKWLDPSIDTNKVSIQYYYDEFTDPRLQ